MPRQKSAAPLPADQRAATLRERDAALKLKLTESVVDFYTQIGLVDYRDLQADLDGFGVYPSLLPPYYRQNQKRGEVLPVYLTEMQLRLIRDRSRRLCNENEFAICAIENRRSYVAGKGLAIRATSASIATPTPPALLERTQKVIDLFSEANGLDELASDVVLRWDREGESFLRCFPQPNGLLLFRPIESEHVSCPQGDAYGPAYSFGIQTNPDDVQSIIGYWVIERPWVSQVRTFVPAADVLHSKLNTDLSAKRGLPTFYPVEQNLRRAEDLLASMTSLAKTRAKLALIRKFNGVLQDTAQALTTSLTEVSQTDPSTGTSINMERLRYGTILNSSKNIEYEMPSANVSAAEYVEVLQAELRAVAARLCMPEWMLSVDASNANYSSSLIAEAPSTKMFERLQRKLALAIGESRRPGNESLVWRQLQYAVQCGILPPSIFQLVKVQVECPSLVVRDKAAESATDERYYKLRVKSRQTIQQQQGLDAKQEDENFRKDGVDPSKPAAEPATTAGGPGAPNQMGVAPHQGPPSAPGISGGAAVRESKDASGHEHDGATGQFTGKLSSSGAVVRFVPHEKATSDHATVAVDPKKLDAEWQKDESYYLPTNGTGKSEVKGRRAGVHKFLSTGAPVQAPMATLNGGFSIEDGRHRFAVLRDLGADAVALTVPKDEAAEFAKRFGHDGNDKQDTIAHLISRGQQIATAIKEKGTAQLDKIPGAKYIRGKVAAVKERLEKRYGAKTMAAIFAAGQVASIGTAAGSGGTLFIPAEAFQAPLIALAEINYQLQRLRGKVRESEEEDDGDGEELTLTPEEIKAAAKELLAEIQAAWDDRPEEAKAD